MAVKICVYGAGAIGGYLAACLHDAGAEVSLIARGPHLAAIQNHGLKLKIRGEYYLNTEGWIDQDPSGGIRGWNVSE